MDNLLGLIWSHTLFNDTASLILSSLILLAYHGYLRRKVKKNPAYTVQAVNRMARTLWVEAMMASGKPDVIAIQTLRNSTMAATFLASTAVLLIMGVLSLTGQGGNLSGTWHALNAFGATRSELFLSKLIMILLDLFTVFFSFSLAVRLYNHVGYLINVPASCNHQSITPAHVAEHLNRAGSYYSLGMRAFYFMIPLVFWLFGPHFMLIATVGLIAVLYRVDRAPKILGDEPL
ncbi:MAG: DUF599 domain-containing protein [Sulfuricellaceae bacterium]|nr:DUF599 domain-containing protein [Sulfuricellaceae bacterium]